MSDREKRQTPRTQPFVAPCRIVEGEQRRAGYLMDLSVRGARLSCDGEPPAAGSEVVLEVRLGRKAGPSQLRARVVWSRSAGKGGVAGVAFLETEEARRPIEAVLAEFHRRAAQLS